MKKTLTKLALFTQSEFFLILRAQVYLLPTFYCLSFLFIFFADSGRKKAEKWARLSLSQKALGVRTTRIGTFCYQKAQKGCSYLFINLVLLFLCKYFFFDHLFSFRMRYLLHQRKDWFQRSAVSSVLFLCGFVEPFTYFPPLDSQCYNESCFSGYPQKNEKL